MSVRFELVEDIARWQVGYVHAPNKPTPISNVLVKGRSEIMSRPVPETTTLNNFKTSTFNMPISKFNQSLYLKRD